MADLTMADVRAKFPQYHDMSDADLAGALHQKFYADLPQDQFNQKIGYTPAPPDTSVGHMALGAGEHAAAAIGNIVPGILNAGADLVSRVTGNGGASPVPMFHAGKAGDDFSTAASQGVESLLDKAGAGDALTSAAGGTDEFAQAHPTTMGVAHGVGDVAALLGARGMGGAVAEAGSNVAAGARGIGSALKGTAFDTAGEGGFRSGEGQNIAKAVAGDSGKKALMEHNQQVGNATMAAEAGHTADAPLSYKAMEDARQGPNDVYTRVGANLPEGQLDETAAAGVNSAGAGNKLVTASQTAQNQIANMRGQLTGQSFTGDQLIDNLRSLRQEGFKRIGSDDVDQQAIGHAQLDMARAVEGHVERNIPQGADVTPKDFTDARKALAKNHAIEGALHGPDVDLKAIARIQRADPNLLDGGMKAAADFANGPGRNVVGLPDSYNTPNVAEDAAGLLDLHKPIQGIAKFLGGAAARSRLTGNTADAVDAARATYGDAPGRFNPRPSLLPPPGRAGRTPVQGSLGDLPQGPGPSPFTLGEGANPNPTAPAGPPGQMSLADLLSHGVEQPEAPGLSAGPMGAPAQHGLPFQADAGHMAGDLSLDHGPPLADLLADLHDHAAVMSQGTPEGTMALAPQKRFVGDTVDFPSGTPRRQIIENNASGESAASIEAQRRLASEKQSGGQPFTIDPEGSAQPIAHTVDAVDLKAPKGHLKVQKDPSTGKLSIVDRGGLTLAAAKGLLNRYLALHPTSLGDELGS